MHALVRRYVKTAILFLFVGLAIGGRMLLRRELFGRYPLPHEVSTHTHAIFVGFVMMMILGVALWLFPRPERGDRAYRPGLVEAAYWLLTVGTAVRVAGELAEGAATGSAALRIIVAVSGLLQIGGLATFFATMWSRIRPAGSQSREARGERF